MYNVRRSSRRFNAIYFLIKCEGLLRIAAKCVRTVVFVIKLDIITQQSILVVGFWVAHTKLHSATRNIAVCLSDFPQTTMI